MNKSNWTRSGSAYMISSHSEVLHGLPVGTYTVMVSPQVGYFLERGPDLELGTTKVYGDVLARRDRILYTYLDRPGNTGVILSGSKGSGKTLLARAVAEKAAKELGMPIIMVNQPHSGDGFNAFLQSIDQDIVVIFDEFEKMYAIHGRDNPQADLLSLFDGATGAARRLFIVTLNDLWGMNSLMLNRPGRFFYHFSYKGLDEEFVREYVAQNLKNQANAESVYVFASAFADFNFDILKAVIEEMNRYDLSAREVVGVLNADPSYDGGHVYEVISWEFKKKKVEIESVTIHGDEAKNVLKEKITIAVAGKDSNDYGPDYYYLDPINIVSIDKAGVVTYESDELKVVIGKAKIKRWSMMDMM